MASEVLFVLVLTSFGVACREIAAFLEPSSSRGMLGFSALIFKIIVFESVAS